jgi:hypothetical protein
MTEVESTPEKYGVLNDSGQCQTNSDALYSLYFLPLFSMAEQP